MTSPTSNRPAATAVIEKNTNRSISADNGSQSRQKPLDTKIPIQVLAAYAADLAAFLAHVARPLQTVTLGDVQAFQNTLATLAPDTEARRLSAVKSLARAAAASCVAWSSAGVSGWRGLALLARP